MAAQGVPDLSPDAPPEITIKTISGKTFRIKYDHKVKYIYEIKKWLADNHGIPRRYQELFDQSSNNKMKDKEKVDRTKTNFNLVIKPMPRFELVIRFYDLSMQIEAVAAWTVEYLYKAVGELFKHPKFSIEIEVEKPNGAVHLLEYSSKNILTEEDIDATSTLRVYKILDIQVIGKHVNNRPRVRVHNERETVKDMTKILCKQFKISSKPVARCKGEIVLPETRLVDLGFQLVRVV